MPLKSVADYIAKEKHLPNMPAAKEIEQDGMELKAMTIKQQEKIEELYLYIIDLNKKMEAMNAEILLLKQQK